MKSIKISEDIVPLGEFKAKAATFIKALDRGGNPLVITQNGRPACVVMAPGAFDALREQLAFLAAVAEGQQDLAAGRTVSDLELGTVLDSEFGEL